MAGFAEHDTIPSQRIFYPATAARTPSARHSLPNGPCNYRESFGACGCNQFWDKDNPDLHDESSEDPPGGKRSAWCMCGHHACFHLSVSRAQERPAPSVAAPLHGAHAQCGEQCQLVPGSQCNVHTSARQVEGHALGTSQDIHSGRTKASHPYNSLRQLRQGGRIEQGRDTPSQASTTGLPGIPSVCMLSRDRRPAANTDARQHLNVNQSRQTIAGLGLSMMHLGSVDNLNHRQSVSPTVADDDDDIARALQRSYSEPKRAPTGVESIAGGPNTLSSPSRGPLGPVFEFNRNLQLDLGGDTVPNTYNPHDYIQSATEAATPSIANTPDLGDADNAVQEGKKLIDTLAQLTSNMQQPNGSPNRPTIAKSAPTQLQTTNSPVAPQEQLQQVLKTASPHVLQKLVSYLAPLHNLLNSIPNVANTMRELGSRLDMLESGSFNYVQPEDLHQMLDMYDSKLVDLEHRMDEHDKHHQAIDIDASISSFNRRRIDMVTDSFASNHSLQSTTSSALILAAMDRKGTETEIGDIKDRLDILEAARMPTTFHPWEVEVILLPWGRQLRGIWFSPDEPMHDATKATTQDSEEWTQARNSKLGSSLRSPHSSVMGAMRDTDSSPAPGARLSNKDSIFTDSEGGWSSEAISDWASESTNDWLFPKACGSKNLVYQRLRSRGFIRDVTLQSASARDIQATLSNAFSDLLEHLKYTDQDEDSTIVSYPGLRASFIPLQKVMKESRLRFLGPAEMSSSALWSAQFLSAGIMMRVSGGKKRLYVTQREAYMQQSDEMGSSWTWQELRQLPRIQQDQNSAMEGNDEHCQPQIPEADAKEACWQFAEAYDAPPLSINSSFGSHNSALLSIRPADRQWRRSITPCSILKNRHLQPLSPQSELPPPRHGHHRLRTASASVVELLPGSSKRRFNSSPVKHSSAPHVHSRNPSASVTRLKRRRVTTSSSPRPEEVLRAEAQLTIWNATPRRSREPPSPFFSSQPLPRSNSDVASRPSQRSVALVGKSTPFGYATPHSGPFVGAPDFGDYGHGGDTEPDDDDVYNDDDGEQSWHGVATGDDDSESSVPDTGAGADEHASFSGEDSGFGTEDDDAEHGGGTQRRRLDEDEDEDGDEIFDTLLNVLKH
ncbi:hypothetical protein P153DRAFT_362237 [Dothidotthia symphoricarpi CBS 119687]|uniref:Uncharacterized protein n=1 Tax=Dothidotthia symphoricarpi CBS 119687 TaxID=1392245 RepID=A0A6A6ATF2_9PLEO|nr:uncharacterized protein P153DRAFT_362237 [Dothidotthia symphoricarpi CBS 119687]KAF2134468.1 hypothetical protein P153DRAFT_362237 [Dothidotthia symphoricarpi CBS 119687]